MEATNQVKPSRLISRVGGTEHRIIRKLVDTILNEGLKIAVWDEEMFQECGPSSQRTRILGAIAHTGESYLYLWQNNTRLGMFQLIHGNDEDVISDLSDNPLCNRIWQEVNDALGM
ncbi:MAG: hypothetical protein KDJ69_12100 [Nitratireductor sp.]|nr:hypothetical protein [Nitratireductor sp.]